MKIEWRKLLSREGVDLTTISGGVDTVFYSLIWKATGTSKELFFTYFKDKGFTKYIAVDPKKVGLYAFKKFFNSVEKIKKYYRDGKLLLKDIEEKSKKWQGKLEPESESQLFLVALRDFDFHLQKVSRVYSIISWFAIEAWQNEFEKMLVSMIERNKLTGQREKITSSVYRPWKNTAILEIREKMKKGADLKKLVEDYQFLRSWSVIWYRPIDESWMKQLGQFPEDVKRGGLYSIEELVELLKPSKEEEHYLRLVPYLTFFKDWRDDLRRKFVYYWSFLFQLIAKKIGITYNNLGYLTLDEIKDCISLGKAPKAVIKKRKTNPCIVTVDAPRLKMKVVDKKVLVAKYIKIMEKIERSTTQGRDILIKGLVAQKGKVQGRVKLVKTYHDIKDTQEGDILVANTTHPNYLPAMQKAAAFVTNEGGIICHVAIVAREMKKPCIVGTKVATQVLKDGDIVEVDADKGVVRILKQ